MDATETCLGYNLPRMALSTEEKYRLLLEIAHNIRDTLDLDEITNHLLDSLQTMVHYDAAGFFVLNQDLVHNRRETPRELIAGITRRGFDPRPVERDAMLMQGDGIIGSVIRNAAPLVIHDVRQDPRYVEGRRSTLSEIAVPLLLNDRAIGALNLESDRVGAYDDDDLELLRFFADAAVIAIQKAMLHRQTLAKQLLDKQLETAQEVQARLLPDKPPHIPGYDLAGICIPTDEIGGDYFDFIPLAHSHLGIAVADVSGHGIASALVMTAFRALLRTYAQSRSAPEHIAQQLNRVLPEFTGSSHFVTLAYAVLSPDRGSITYTSCGHPMPLVIRADGSCEQKPTRCPPLGIIANVSYTADEIELAPGDLLAVYTDGVIENIGSDGSEFGVQRLIAALQSGRHLPADRLIQEVIQQIQAFSGTSSSPDDFTLVILRHDRAQG
jgi:sigma-B regulation protein RsbU (phosphoserine phosphatase)